MPNVNDIYGGEFLKQEHISKPTTLTITETGMATFEDGKQQIVLHFRGTEKVLGLNATNANFCADTFQSPDSDVWIGKQIEVYVDPNVMMKGKRVGGVRIRLPNSGGAKSDVPATTHPDGPGRYPAPPAPTATGHRTIDEFDDDIPF